MAQTQEEAMDCIKHLYVMEYLRNHLGVSKRHDVCISLEFLVWLKANHSTLVNFFESQDELICQIQDYIHSDKS
ncbi:MAG: hypothetical protein ACPGYX_01715 [Oceanobacter sp.]